MSRKSQAQREPPMMAGDRTLPHSLEAERSILGAILLHGETLDQIADALEPGDFYRDAHRRIYGAMLTLSEATTPIELVTLREQLGKRGDLDEVGGAAYISALVDGIPRGTNIVHYAGIVKEKSRLRQAIHTGNKLLQAAYEASEPSAEVVNRAAEALYDLGGEALPGRPVLLRDLSAAGMEQIERSHASGVSVTGLATGYTGLDEMTAGLQATDLILVAARTSMGKTALAMNIARNVSAKDTTLVFSLEMSKLQLYMRLLASEAGVDSHRLRAGYLSDQEWARLAKAMGTLSECHMLIDDTPSIGVLEVRARARQVKAERGLGLIVVDYIQLMRGRGRFDNRVQEIGSISRGLKAVAKELNVPIVALCQLSRAPEAGHGRKARRPTLSDLRESGDLENDADVVLIIYRAEESKDDELPIAEIIIAKQRNGPTSVVKLAWMSQYVRFDNLAMV